MLSPKSVEVPKEVRERQLGSSHRISFRVCCGDRYLLDGQL